MAPIREDEYFKAGAHGLLLGCSLPILAYNIVEHLRTARINRIKGTKGRRRNLFNAGVYFVFLGFELYNITEHLRAGRTEGYDGHH